MIYLQMSGHFCIFPSQALFHILSLSSDFFQEHYAFTVIEKEFAIGLMPYGAWKVPILKHLLFSSEIGHIFSLMNVINL